VDGFGWKLGTLIWMEALALSGSFSCFKHGGRQMLGPNRRGYQVPDTEVLAVMILMKVQCTG
jgi:hypothetical protein